MLFVHSVAHVRDSAVKNRSCHADGKCRVAVSQRFSCPYLYGRLGVHPVARLGHFSLCPMILLDLALDAADAAEGAYVVGYGQDRARHHPAAKPDQKPQFVAHKDDLLFHHQQNGPKYNARYVIPHFL